ncbi:MAG: PorT family protein, partial [Alphaproteobacteria bacterium]|nr:PorT family protein [Alphaproteobacteria bacterium]
AGSSLQTSGGNGVELPEAILSVKKGDLGFAYGAGLDFGLNQARNIRLGVGFRGVYGLFDISDNSKTSTTDGYYVLDRTKIKTYSGYVGVSILF